jgi:hypothetical protein
MMEPREIRDIICTFGQLYYPNPKRIYPKNPFDLGYYYFPVIGAGKYYRFHFMYKDTGDLIHPDSAFIYAWDKIDKEQLFEAVKWVEETERIRQRISRNAAASLRKYTQSILSEIQILQLSGNANPEYVGDWVFDADLVLDYSLIYLAGSHLLLEEGKMRSERHYNLATAIVSNDAYIFSTKRLWEGILAIRGVWE